MNKNAFESGRKAAKILAILSAVGCVAMLLADDNPPLQGALVLLTMLLFVSMFLVIVLRCRCPHCGKVILLGLWNAKVCSSCRRSLSSGNKVKGKKR